MVRELKAELVVDANAALGEGPVWHEGHVLWIDISNGRIHRYDPVADRDESWEVGQAIGALVPRDAGGLLLALRDGFAALPALGEQPDLLVPVEQERTGNRMNDGKCDSRGRFWASTMAFDASAGAGTFYRLDPDLSVRAMLSDLTIGNGLDWTDDDRTMYFIDSGTGGVDALDFDAEAGTISNRRQVVAIPEDEGIPDGMTLDAEGYLWVALFRGWGVRRYAPDGTLDTVVRVPAAQVTACTFAGDDLGDLYITTAAQGLEDDELADQPHAGGLFRVRPGVSGTRPNSFAG